MHRMIGRLAGWLTIAGLVTGQIPSVTGAEPSRTNRAVVKAAAPPVYARTASWQTQRNESAVEPPSTPVPPLPGGEALPAGVWPFDGDLGHELLSCQVPELGMWAQVDYLIWWRKGRALPSLVTTTPNGGVLPGATILFGNEAVGDRSRPGGRLRLGTWLNCENTMTVEGGLMMLGADRERFATDSSEHATIARPFFNLTDDLMGGVIGQDALQVALPGVSTGSILVTSDSDVLIADATLRKMLLDAPLYRLDMLIGYEAARIDEDLRISSSTTLTSNGTRIDVLDVFDTRNEFHGGHLGLELQKFTEMGSLQLLARVGLGNMKQSVQIAGQQTITTVGGSPTTVSGGLLAQPTNIGSYSRDVFAVTPELTLQYVRPLTDCLEFSAGYTLLYFNRVVQPG
jgi:hypothetical protein